MSVTPQTPRPANTAGAEGTVSFVGLGIGLDLLGGVIALAAIIPVDWLARLLGPPRGNTTLGVYPDFEEDWKRWWSY